MSTTITGGSTTITLTKSVSFIVSPIRKNLDFVHVPYTDLTIVRNRGYVDEVGILSVTETFSDISTAQAFISNIGVLLGEVCTVNHDGSASYTEMILEGHNDMGIEPNNYPGFHVSIVLNFRRPSR